MLKDKNIILGITGSIAAYKIANLASMLKKEGANVEVIMTKNATQFITPLTFETLTGNKCYTDTFDRDFKFEVEHISLAKKADVCLIAPASANVIGKIANGIADDMLTTTIMAMKCPVIFSPAMNTNMFENAIVQDNIEKLKFFDYEVIEPAKGYLACGDTGAGKMPEPEVLFEYIEKALCPKDLVGKKVVVTAGPTQEAIDPVRYITNHSTGKMGCAVAKAAAYRGADVTLISGEMTAKAPSCVKNVDVISAADMFEAVKEVFPTADIIIKSAAVADYTPVSVATEKIKKKDEDMSIPLKRTTDILKWLGENKRDDQIIVGFAMETENVIENSRKKLAKKNADMIVANSLRTDGAGFGTDTNVVTIITEEVDEELPKMSKLDVANEILNRILEL